MKHLVSTPAQLGKVLRGIRRSKKLSQTEVGKMVGLLQKTVSTVESDPGRSSIESLFKLLSALDLVLTIQTKQEVAADNSDHGW